LESDGAQLGGLVSQGSEGVVEFVEPGADDQEFDCFAAVVGVGDDGLQDVAEFDFDLGEEVFAAGCEQAGKRGPDGDEFLG
jgi:hypothetical protein